MLTRKVEVNQSSNKPLKLPLPHGALVRIVRYKYPVKPARI